MLLSLNQLAVVRSGDKGNHANIGVVARSAECYALLERELTGDRVRQFFGDLPCSAVRRYELPRIQALNFVLENVLAGGASRSLRLDTQGKLLGVALMELEILAEQLPAGAADPHL